MRSDDPELHLLVDGRRVDPIERRSDGGYAFRLDRKPDSVRLRSRSAVPQELGTARDPRMLGTAVRRLLLEQGWRLQAVAALSLTTEGFHDYEPADDMRWTNGDAAIAADLFAWVSGPATLIVGLGSTTQYVDDGEAAAA